MYLKVVRVGRPSHESEVISSAYDVYKLLNCISKEDRENLYVVHLDTQNRFLAKENIAKGSLNVCRVALREIFKGVCLNNTAAIILVHNHTGGKAIPGKDDFMLTDKVKEFARLINVTMHDHLIIGDGELYSIEYRVRFIIPSKKSTIDELIEKCMNDYGCVTSLMRLNKEIYDCSLCVYDKHDGYAYLYMSEEDNVRIIFDSEYRIVGVEED